MGNSIPCRLHSLWLIFLLTALAGCQDNGTLETPPDDDGFVSVDMAYAVATPAVALTRMVADTAQANETSPFRGLADVRIVPFKGTVGDTVRSNSTPTSFMVLGTGLQLAGATSHEVRYYYSHCTFMTGTSAVLFYGRAPASLDKASNGSLVVTYPQNMNPLGISFSLEPIVTTLAVPSAAQAIADYLTSVASVTGWSSCSDATTNGTDGRTVAELYDYLIGRIGSDVALLPGSTSSAKAHANYVKARLNDISGTTGVAAATQTLISQIVTEIDKQSTLEDYPSSLPDGAAALRWSVTDKKFVPQMQTTNLADINSIDRFAYPAELYYYGNSPLVTSADTMFSTDYPSSRLWTHLTDTIATEFTNHYVTGVTRSVAVTKPVGYGVACMKLVLKKTAGTTIPDGKNQAIAVGALGDDKFPLKGIIINGQRSVGFDFVPTGTTDIDDYFVYDNKVGNVFLCDNSDQSPVYTLLLQSYTGQKVTVMLEFQNNSGSDFQGQDGTIYNGTRFYLAGVVDVSNSGQVAGNSRPRAFTRGETTTVNVTVESLAKAYNVMPSLLSPRLQLGIKLETQWNLTDPTEVPLY